MVAEYNEYLCRRGFELKDQIGSGLSGRTFKAIQGSLNRQVAIKFFDSALNKNNANLKKKFLREALLLADLEHPSIPYVITSGSIPIEDDFIPYIVMQFIPGISLDEYIKDHSPITIDTALNISAQVLEALSLVHKKGIVHRDIKPSNIMMLSSGHCYVIDFSIGFKIEPQAGMTRATKTGDHLGSIQYMSPEQKKNMKEVDERTDVYSYSLVLCEMLSGKPELQSLTNSNMKYPSALKKVIEKACSYETSERYNNANEFLRELKQVSSTSLPFLDTPSRAICNNVLCPSANWSSQGYYRGPNYIEESTECGTQQFNIPECLKCGSFLRKTDMNKDTQTHGCEKCRAKVSSPNIVNDVLDDIPF